MDSTAYIGVSPAAYTMLLADAEVRRKLNRERAEQLGTEGRVELRYERPQMNRKQRRAREAQARKKT